MLLYIRIGDKIMSKSIKTFQNIAIAVKTNRETANISQGLLAKAVGYKNAQFISNVERGLCSIPAEKVKVLSKTLNIAEEEIINAMVADYKESLKKNL